MSIRHTLSGQRPSEVQPPSKSTWCCRFMFSIEQTQKSRWSNRKNFQKEKIKKKRPKPIKQWPVPPHICHLFSWFRWSIDEHHLKISSSSMRILHHFFIAQQYLISALWFSRMLYHQVWVLGTVGKIKHKLVLVRIVRFILRNFQDQLSCFRENLRNPEIFHLPTLRISDEIRFEKTNCNSMCLLGWQSKLSTPKIDLESKQKIGKFKFLFPISQNLCGDGLWNPEARA